MLSWSVPSLHYLKNYHHHVSVQKLYCFAFYIYVCDSFEAYFLLGVKSIYILLCVCMWMSSFSTGCQKYGLTP